MKKINILAIALALLTVSCDDFLDTPSKSSLDEKVVFSSEELADAAVLGIVVSMAETESYRGRFLPWYGLNTDCEWYNSSDKTDAKADLAVYRTSATNTEMNRDKNAWAKMYEGIEKANICIRGLRSNQLSVPGTVFGQLLGESLTLRAVLYADLVKAWGDVPARFEPVTTATLYIPKSDRDTIYKRIIADLDEAAKLVYWPNENTFTNKVTRINKAFVKGLRARLCLNAAGYSQRPDSDIPRLSNDPQLSKAVLYPIAKQELLDVYTHMGAGKLESSFETVFRKLCEEDVTAGGESLWQIPMSDGRGRMAYTFSVKHTQKDQYTNIDHGGLGGQVGPTPHLFYDYDVKDSRRDVTCVPYEWGNGNPSQQQLRSLANWCFGKYRYEWMKRRAISKDDDGLQKQYMRYSEVILMLAEVTNELDGYAAAAPYLKEIRQRAFPSDQWSAKVEGYVNAIGSKDAMLNAIIDENAFEFAGEMIRKESLIRWNMLQSKLTDSKQKMYELREQKGRYSDVPSVLYYRIAKDNETLEIYGLNRGETQNKSSEYTFFVDWVGAGKLKDSKIEALFAREPNKYQYWPIWAIFINNSNGQLKNDYGY